jgi:GT2 family glycosyltransferase
MHNPYFSILIPTWYNMEFFKLCIRTIRAHSEVSHEIIVHISEGNDRAFERVRNEGIKHIQSSENLGV